MRPLSTRLCISLALVALLALPAAAGAEYFVPPSNSAANQYTESFPTAKGERDAERDADKEKPRSSPALNERDARELRSHGAAGEAVAEVVIETAPTTAAAEAVETVERKRPAAKDSKAGKKVERRAERERQEAAAAASGGDSGGSSGLGAVLAGATGLSADGTGALLPLAILAAIFWAFAYRRRHTASASA